MTKATKSNSYSYLNEIYSIGEQMNRNCASRILNFRNCGLRCLLIDIWNKFKQNSQWGKKHIWNDRRVQKKIVMGYNKKTRNRYSNRSSKIWGNWIFVNIMGQWKSNWTEFKYDEFIVVAMNRCSSRNRHFYK